MEVNNLKSIKMNNQKAKVGDTVKILNDIDGHDFKIGQLVTIRERHKNRAFGIVGNIFQYVCDGNYKIVKQKEIFGEESNMILASSTTFEPKDNFEKRKDIFKKCKQSSDLMDRVKDIYFESEKARSIDASEIEVQYKDVKGVQFYITKRPIEQIINEGKAMLAAKDNEIEKIKSEFAHRRAQDNIYYVSQRDTLLTKVHQLKDNCTTYVSKIQEQNNRIEEQNKVIEKLRFASDKDLNEFLKVSSELRDERHNKYLIIGAAIITFIGFLIAWYL